jgi:hypothetical protein
MKKIFYQSVLLGFFCTLSFTQLLSAAECQGIAVQAEFLGTKITADMRDNTYSNNSILQLAPREEWVKNPVQNLVRSSSSYNPNALFLEQGLNFEATSFARAAAINGIPPDVNGSVGERQYIYTLNQAIQSFDKKTGLPDEALNSTMAGFFGTAISDPRIVYDRCAKVWYVSAMNREGTGGLPRDIFLAVSHDSVITDCTAWDFFKIPYSSLIPNDPAGNIDFPQLGYDQKAVYMTVDCYDSLSFAGIATIVIQKSSLLAGSPNITVFPALYVGDPDNPANFASYVNPVSNFDPCPKYGYIFCTFPGQPGPIQYFAYFRILNSDTTTPTRVGPIFQQVPVYYPDGNVPHKGNLFPAFNRIQQTWINSLGGAHIRKGQLFMAGCLSVDSTGASTALGDRTGTIWYQMDLSGDSSGGYKLNETDTTVPAIVQTDTIFDPAQSDPIFYYNPSIMTNKRGDLIVQGTLSGVNNYTNIWYCARKRKDPLGTTRNPVLLTNNTSNAYNFGPVTGFFEQRWGDYSTIFTDPSNDLNFWLSSEYAGILNGWSVQVIELIPTN